MSVLVVMALQSMWHMSTGQRIGRRVGEKSRGILNRRMRSFPFFRSRQCGVPVDSSVQSDIQVLAHPIPKEFRERSPNTAVPLHFMEIGCGTVMQAAEPVIILHGLLGNSMNFNTWAKDLFSKLDSNRRIIIPDLRNHGQSPHTSSMHYREMMEDVLLLMDSQQIEKAEFIGHSMGGKVAAALALCHPDRVASLAVLDIAPVNYSEEDASWWQVDEVVSAMSAVPVENLTSRKDANDFLVNTIPDDLLRGFALTNLQQYNTDQGLKFKWRINVNAIKQFLPEIKNFDIGQGKSVDLTTTPTTYDGDVFFLSGRRSKYISSRHLPAIAQLFPKYRMVTIKNAGHWVHAESPEETANYCKTFLDRQAAKRAGLDNVRDPLM